MALIAAQLYTLREFCKTPADIATSCYRVKKMGYDGVQLSGIGAIEPTEMRKILDGEGLLCAATHRSLDQMENAAEALIEEHHILDCKYTAIGGFSPKEDWTRAGWGAFVTRYNALAAKFADAGLRIGYHNHSHEFAPAEGIRPLDLLINTLDERVWIEIDTYWVAHGGGDPAAYIERVAGRIPCVHFKDMTITPQRTHKMCEIGDGNLNWPRIVQACRYAGVIWHIVERDSGDMDAFDSLQRSLDNMREKMGL
ncbi:MAG TPA: sugar phosphate isomerase/epimerase [Lentisphaeria bacterium]|nr:sugar phosphate isomerase/epimerase [Lentisphaerota bacterium]HQC53792.1 sugar phosphate isomerase/epimerase [Lentisphaeria bacterium]HQL88936.1 sugar phosphate isomerase/epimerase [Lentisphaeria bacterium]